MYLVVGLGNPDAKYKNNVHNLGFMGIDALSQKLGVSFDKKGHKGVYTVFSKNGEKVVLLKPHTYMNLSGESVQSIASFYKIPSSNILVIYDDIDFDIGTVKIRAKGSAGTHNGMKSVVNMLGTTEFPRVRIGCKPPSDFKGDLVDYVLSNLRAEDKPFFDSALDRASDAALSFIKGEKIDIIMNKFNG
ncbi:MAG: aminoacyl-tRNA hydrolase [Clostridia bacterium]|nr:aminoacyl-tRNA hydrolase [Clostridia bacterium]